MQRYKDLDDVGYSVAADCLVGDAVTDSVGDTTSVVAMVPTDDAGEGAVVVDLADGRVATVVVSRAGTAADVLSSVAARLAAGESTPVLVGHVDDLGVRDGVKAAAARRGV